MSIREQAKQAAEELQRDWDTNPRWKGIERTHSAETVIRLRGSVREEHTLARQGAERLWKLLHETDYINALGALTGNQAVQQVRAGLQAIYLSGWQVAADANLAGETYPDQSLYPANSVPAVVRRINNALKRADQINWSEALDPEAPEGESQDIHWMAPIVADAEAGFGGVLNAYELMKAMIAAGAAGVHWEDQLASEKKCGHLGGKVLIPTGQHIKTLNAARLAADICGVPTLIIARTDAEAATLITTDVDERDKPFLTGERTPEGAEHDDRQDQRQRPAAEGPGGHRAPPSRASVFQNTTFLSRAAAATLITYPMRPTAKTPAYMSSVRVAVCIRTM